MNTCKGAAALQWIVIISLGLAACTEHKPVQAPDVKLNPSPKKRYEITLTILDDPRPISNVKGRAQFNIRNLDCVPMDYARAIGGIKPVFDSFLEINLSRRSYNRYVGYLYEDAYLPQDYYGLGVCNWKLTAVHAFIDSGETIQLAGLDGDFAVTEKQQFNLCPRPQYSHKSITNHCTIRPSGQSTNTERERNYIATMDSRRIAQ